MRPASRRPRRLPARATRRCTSAAGTPRRSAAPSGPRSPRRRLLGLSRGPHRRRRRAGAAARRRPARGVRLRRQGTAGRAWRLPPACMRRGSRRAAPACRSTRSRGGPAGFERGVRRHVAGATAETPAMHENWIKAYPCCLATHSTIEAALQLRGSGGARAGRGDRPRASRRARAAAASTTSPTACRRSSRSPTSPPSRCCAARRASRLRRASTTRSGAGRADSRCAPTPALARDGGAGRGRRAAAARVESPLGSPGNGRWTARRCARRCASWRATASTERSTTARLRRPPWSRPPASPRR